MSLLHISPEPYYNNDMQITGGHTFPLHNRVPTVRDGMFAPASFLNAAAFVRAARA